MIIKPLLELRQLSKVHLGHATFFRYDVAGAKVWFDQHEDGHIYMVYVSLPETLTGFNIYVTCDADTLFYPVDIYAEMSHRRFDCGNANQVAEQVLQVKQIIKAIESIFGSGTEHHNLWATNAVMKSKETN